MKRIALVTLLAGSWVCSRAESNGPLPNFWTQGKPGQPPAGLEVSLLADKTNYFLGENILLHYRIRNAATNSFKISVGGDYRGSSRADRFTVTALSADGKPVADPTPLMRNFGGGLSPGGELKPGTDWYEKVWVIEYCRFDAPGTYTIRAFHDLGFGEKITLDPREASCTVQLQAPTEAEAEAILVAAENSQPYHGSTWGQKGEARLEYPCIRWPTFLKPLLRRAQAGSGDALEGIKSIRTLEATRALVELLEHPNAAQALEARLPHPAGDFTGPWGDQRRQFIIEGAWDESLGPPVREFCKRLLAQRDRSSLLTASSLLRLIGTTNELGALRRALEFAVVQSTPEFLSDIHYPPPVRVCDALIGVILGLDAAWVGTLDPDQTPGNLLLYLNQHRGAEKTLSDSDVKYFSKALNQRLPYLRMKALEKLPDAIPAALANDLTRCLTDDNVGVQNYAFLAAQRVHIPAHRDIALAVLKSATDDWLRGNAQQIATKYGARYECALAWCAHLIVPRDINDYTTHDALRHLLEITTGHLSGGGFTPPLTPDTARELRQRWEKFLSENQDAIDAGKQFSTGSAGLPENLLPPGWSLDK